MALLGTLANVYSSGTWVLTTRLLIADAAIVEMDDAAEGAGEKLAPKERRGLLYKKYGPWFIWGQLNAWYKQTVYDPTASLSAERRGTISLPDVECAFAGSRTKYSTKVGIHLLCLTMSLQKPSS